MIFWFSDILNDIDTYNGWFGAMDEEPRQSETFWPKEVLYLITVLYLYRSTRRV